MSIFKTIFGICSSIMDIKLYLLGYSVTLFNVLCYVLVGSILLYFLFRVAR